MATVAWGHLYREESGDWLIQGTCGPVGTSRGRHGAASAHLVLVPRDVMALRGLEIVVDLLSWCLEADATDRPAVGFETCTAARVTQRFGSCLEVEAHVDTGRLALFLFEGLSWAPSRATRTFRTKKGAPAFFVLIEELIAEGIGGQTGWSFGWPEPVPIVEAEDERVLARSFSEPCPLSWARICAALDVAAPGSRVSRFDAQLAEWPDGLRAVPMRWWLRGSANIAICRMLDLRGAAIGEREANDLARDPRLARFPLVFLDDDCLGDCGVALLASSPHVRAVRELSLGNVGCGDAGIAALAAARFDALEALSLYSNRVSSTGLRALAQAPWMAGVKTLDLEGNPIDDEGLTVLAESPGARALTSLYLAGAKLTVRSPGAITRDGAFPALTHLALPPSNNPQRDALFTATLGSRGVVVVTRGESFAQKIKHRGDGRFERRIQ